MDDRVLVRLAPDADPAAVRRHLGALNKRCPGLVVHDRIAASKQVVSW